MRERGVFKIIGDDSDNGMEVEIQRPLKRFPNYFTYHSWLEQGRTSGHHKHASIHVDRQLSDDDQKKTNIFKINGDDDDDVRVTS